MSAGATRRWIIGGAAVAVGAVMIGFGVRLHLASREDDARRAESTREIFREPTAAAATVTAAARTETPVDAKSWSPERRSQKMREVCGPTGTFAPGWVLELVDAAATPSEKAGLEDLCISLREQRVAEVRGWLKELKALESRARAVPASARLSDDCVVTRLRADWEAVDELRGRVNAVSQTIPGVAMMRVTIGYVRACFSCKEPAEALAECATARDLFRDIETELAEKQWEYCAETDPAKRKRSAK